MTRPRIALMLALLAGLACVAALALHWRTPDQDTLMARRLLDRVPTPQQAQVDCHQFIAQRPLVLLVLGQSNAGNHGSVDGLAATPATVQVMNAGRCSLSQDPLPGATGAGSSPWSLLPPRLAAAGVQRPVVLQLLAVDASSVDDWARPSAPIARQLALTLAANRAAGLPPDLVLWQQGETDARAGTAPDRYAHGLTSLVASLRANGVTAPVLLARSTVCRSAPAEGLRVALEALAGANPGVRLGPDTDAIQHRHDGCHWSDSGRRQVADLWAISITEALPAAALTRQP